jgi:hypothetical protein
VTSRTAIRRLQLERRPAAGELVSFAGLPVAVEEETAAAIAELLKRPDSRAVGYGWTAYHRARQVDVPAELRRRVVVGAGKPNRCYQLAALYVLGHADQPVTLAHGFVVEEGLPWSHGWVELPDDALYDPTTGRFFDRASFYEVLQATPLATYTAAEAVARMQATGTVGPWEECIGRQVELCLDWIGRLQQEHPELLEWVERMCLEDPAFDAAYMATCKSGLIVLHVLHHLARHPRLWQGVEPGADVRWLKVLHPLGPLW